MHFNIILLYTAWNFHVVSFFQVFTADPCLHISSLMYVTFPVISLISLPTFGERKTCNSSLLGFL